MFGLTRPETEPESTVSEVDIRTFSFFILLFIFIVGIKDVEAPVFESLSFPPLNDVIFPKIFFLQKFFAIFPEFLQKFFQLSNIKIYGWLVIARI